MVPVSAMVHLLDVVRTAPDSRAPDYTPVPRAPPSDLFHPGEIELMGAVTRGEVGG